MSHVDDGTLNALLDGELTAEEAAAVEAHIAACPECAKRLAEAKRFLAEATDLLGALELPKPAVAEPSARRVPKTAREIALDLDGATQQSPAIRPNLAGEPPKRASVGPPTRRRLDFTTLAWAATVVLAIGVGYLANEVRHTRQTIALGEGAVGRPVQSPEQASPAVATQPAAPTPPPNAVAPPTSTGARRGQPTRGAQAKSVLAAGGAPATAAELAHKETPALRDKQLAAAVPSDQAAAQPRPGRAAKTLETVGGVGGAAERPTTAVVAAEPPAVLMGADRNAAAPIQRGAVAAFAEQRLTSFRRAALEEAVARLGGSLRLIDGMRIDHVEVGPGSRVSGAARNLDVVRIVYVDDQGRRVVLDQQRLAQPADSSAAERQGADVGMGYGDTLTTEAPDGQVRVRWVDRERFWLSLTASLAPDTARALVGRVR